MTVAETFVTDRAIKFWQDQSREALAGAALGFVLDRAGLQAALDLGVGELLAFQELLGERVVALGGGLDHLRAVFVR